MWELMLQENCVRISLNYWASRWYHKELLGEREKNTHLVIRIVKSEMFSMSSKGKTHRKRSEFFPLSGPKTLTVTTFISL